MTVKTLAAGMSAAMLVFSPIAVAQQPAGGSLDFGDDASSYSKDGECDDPRFTGAGMTDTKLLDSDIRHDATDCKAAYDAGNLQIKEAGASSPATAPQITAHGINFGDDASNYSKDGECDDPRFTGAGMTDTELLTNDTRHDATDCLTAFEAGQLVMK